MKKLSGYLSLFLLVFFIFAGTFTCSTINAEAASNSLSATYKCMYVGQTYTPSIKGSYSSVKWATSNSNIASVTSKGKVTAKNIGRANIYATVHGKKLTLKVEIVSKTAYKAVNYANKAVGCRYSQAKRMKKGCYDCGSLVWRSYSNAGLYIGGKSSWAPTASDGARILNKSGKAVSYSAVSASELLPGDLIYTSTRSNGRYRNITHAAIYVGNGKIVEAANSRVGVVKRNYSTRNIVFIGRPSVNVASSLQEPLMTSVKTRSSAVNNTTIDVSWKKVRGASGYNIYRKAQGGSFKKIATVKGNNTLKYTDKKAYAGKYIYTVRAYSGSKISPYNKTGMTATTKIAAPGSISVKSTDKSIKVSWNKVSYATSYRVYRKAKGGSYKLLKTVSGKTTTFNDSSAKPDVNYSYAVKAVRANSSSYTTVGNATYSNRYICYHEPEVLPSSSEETVLTASKQPSKTETSTAAVSSKPAAETTAKIEVAAETTVEAVTAAAIETAAETEAESASEPQKAESSEASESSSSESVSEESSTDTKSE